MQSCRHEVVPEEGFEVDFFAALVAATQEIKEEPEEEVAEKMSATFTGNIREDMQFFTKGLRVNGNSKPDAENDNCIPSRNRSNVE